ncbi:MAG: hypothetical protein ACO20H_00450 [Bacteriovoracaceae bacterium]
MKLLNKYILLFFVSLSCFGANYYPLPFSKQLLDSQGVIRAVFNGSKVRKLSSGRIMTEGSFKILESAGISPAEIINPDDFKVLYPGGVYQGLVYKNTGTPEFKVGEEVILILSKKSGSFSIHNLSLGKYKVMRERKGNYMVSEVFPNNNNIGKKTIEYFNQYVQKRFNQSLSNKYRNVDRVNTLNQQRKIASIEEGSSEEAGNRFEMFWIVLLLIGLSALSISIQNRE